MITMVALLITRGYPSTLRDLTSKSRTCKLCTFFIKGMSEYLETGRDGEAAGQISAGMARTNGDVVNQIYSERYTVSRFSTN